MMRGWISRRQDIFNIYLLEVVYIQGFVQYHCGDVIMGTMASQITSLTIVYSTVWSVADQRKHQSSALLAFVRGIHRWPVNSPHKWSVTRKMFPFDDVIMLHNRYISKPLTVYTVTIMFIAACMQLYIYNYKDLTRILTCWGKSLHSYVIQSMLL